MPQTITVVVAAGGRAARLRSPTPKSLLSYGDRTYLHLTLEALRPFTFQNIVVATNRADCYDRYQSIAAGFSPARIVQDFGVASTLELARDAAVVADCSHILFLYGHAPRAARQIAALLDRSSRDPSPLVLSAWLNTTKREPIPWHNDRFLEPPYLVSRALLATTSANTWGSLFRECQSAVSFVPMEGPGEFNYPDDVPAYENYLSQWTPHQWAQTGAFALA